MNRVFVSYSRRDKTFAERLARDLSDAGLEVWIDFRQIHAGEMWQEEIFRGLQRSDMVVVALSPDAVNSVWVQREVNTAREQGKLIIPVMAVEALTEVKTSTALGWLQNVHFIRFPTRYEEAFRELLDALPGKRSISAFDDIDPANIPNPFKGLEAFQQTDSRFFFGREDLIRKALNILEIKRSTRLLAVVGASGSGKSSLVRAGVIPQLRAGRLPKSEAWRLAIFAPGSDPVEALATRLAPLLGETHTAQTVEQQLATDPYSLTAFAGAMLQDTSPEVRLLLVVDQFEETFTRAPEAAADVFIELIYNAATAPDGRVQVLLTMRADFFDRLGRYPQLAELFEQENLIIVTEMTPANLLRTIEGPARAVGLIYEDGLVDRILEDVRRQPGSLPLLQYALKALYDRRDGRTLTNAAYDEIGGVEQALAKHAETVYTGLNSAQQDIVRRLMLRLVEVSESGEATRRRVQREDLAFQGVSPQAVREILDLLTAAESRLLIASREIRTSGDAQNAPVIWYEVSHEALIREWDRFRGWIADNLENLRYGSELLKAASDWNQAGRDAAYLLTGNRLIRAEVWLEHGDASVLQREFIRTSVEERTRRESVRQEQVEREIRLQRRVANGLRALVAVLVVGLLVALGLTGFAFGERQRAEENARIAEENARIAEENELVAEESERIARSFGLSAAGERAQLDGENELGLALVVQAAQISENPPPQTLLTLSSVVYAPGTRRVMRQEAAVFALALVPGSDLALAGGEAGSLAVWNTATGEQVSSLSGYDAVSRVTAVAVNHAGTQAVTGSLDGVVIQWDLTTGSEIRRLLPADDADARSVQINVIAFTPDDTQVLIGASDGTLTVRDTTTGERVAELIGHGDSVTKLVINPLDGNQVLTASRDGLIRLWDLAQQKVIARMTASSEVTSLAISPDGDTMAVGYELTTETSAIIRLFSLLDFIPIGNAATVANAPDDVSLPNIVLQSGGHTDDVLTLAFSPDGTQLASGGSANDTTVLVWDVAGGQVIQTFNGHNREVRAVTFRAPGSRLLSASSDGTLRLWDTTRAEIVRDFVGHNSPGVIGVYGAGERTMLSGSNDSTLRLWDVATGRTIQEFSGHTDRVFAVDLSADGTRAISGGEDATVRVWDVETGQALLTIDALAGEVEWLSFLPGDTQFVVGGTAGGLAVWDVATGAMVRIFDDMAVNGLGVDAFALSEDGTRLVTAFSTPDPNDPLNRIPVIYLWDVATGTPLLNFEAATSAVRQLAISPDNTLIASGGQNGQVVIWDAQGVETRTFDGHDRAVVGLAFTRDNTSLISAGFDYTIRMWDLSSGFEVRRYSLSEQVFINLQNLTYGASGTTLLTGLTDGSLRLWRLIPTVDDLLIWTFQNRYVPQLTCDQRVQFRLEACDAAGNPPTETAIEIPPVTPAAPGLLVLQSGLEAYVNSSGGDAIRLRRTPDTTSNDTIVRSLVDGEIVTLLEGPVTAVGLNWWRVQTEDGTEGFVAEYLPDEGLQILVPVSAFDVPAAG